jgi:hypothetical protein
MPELRHHAEVIAHGGVLGVQAVAQYPDVGLPYGELSASGWKRDRLRAHREDDERSRLTPGHPYVRHRSLAIADDVDGFEVQAAQRESQPPAGGRPWRPP